MSSEPFDTTSTTTPAGIREVVLWWIRTSDGWGRAGHVAWRALAVLALVICLILPWGPVSSADDAEPPDGPDAPIDLVTPEPTPTPTSTPAGPTAQDAADAAAAVDAGALDVAEAEAALAGLRAALRGAQIHVQSAAADYQEAAVALAAAEQEVRDARAAADRAAQAEERSRSTLAGVYRTTRHSAVPDGVLGSLEVVLDAENVDDLIGQDAAERAVARKLAAALSGYAEARAASESADARWSAAREARAEAKREAEAAYQAAQEAVEDLERRTEVVERDRAVLIERLARLRDTSVQIEREREAARAAAEQAAREAAAREALAAAEAAEAEAAQAEADRSLEGDAEHEPAPVPAPENDPPGYDPPSYDPPSIPDPGIQVPEGDAAQGQLAVGWARTRIGAPYRLGAAGPVYYDCSGLTSEAWRAAGTWITRTSRSQYLAVSHVGYAALRPGDLIFYGTDGTDPQSIYHVAMYTGDGRMIEAVMPGVPLRETNLRLDGAMPYAGRP
ncbi:C40 family peptidase [Myceligenerans crystallogenes]|uniref:NlpC/P60 domain-containing protein n=1 Tax=Myceligenerans crystallogenes TaxID=316335 RepID=A0ABP4ZIX4_9MICO